MFETFARDVTLALRRLGRRPMFTLVAVATLALGLGASTAVFTVVNGVLLRPLPFQAPQDLVMVWLDNRTQGVPNDLSSYPGFELWRQHSKSFQSLACASRESFALDDGSGPPERRPGGLVSADFFTTLGVVPLLGRTFRPGEDVLGNDTVAVLSERLWRQRFGADPNILGRTLTIENTRHQVIGVVPAAVSLPTEAEIWLPLAPTERLRTNMGLLWLQVIGRLAPGVDLATARAELAAVADGLGRERPEVESGFAATLEPLYDNLVGEVRGPLLILLAAVGLLLLITCANVLNLLLAEGVGRERETALRAALGAQRVGLVRQLLVESLLIALAGGGLGLMLGEWASRGLLRWKPGTLPRLAEVGLDVRVVLFALGLCLITTLLFGLVPALRASQPSFSGLLKEGAAGSGQGRRGARLQRALVAAELALALVLLVGAGLLGESFRRLRAVDLGVDPARALTLQVELPFAEPYANPPAVINFQRQLLEQARALPGVAEVSLSTALLRGAGYDAVPFAMEGRPPEERESGSDVALISVSPGFFAAAGIPLRAGVDVNATSTFQSQPVVVVNEAVARRWWPGQSPLGARVRIGTFDRGTPWMEVVGVVGDVRTDGPGQPAPPTFYLPFQQYPLRQMTLVARLADGFGGDPSSLAPGLRQAVRAVDPRLPVTALQPMAVLMAEQTAEPRFFTLLSSAFGLVAFLLAVVGIYGVVSVGVQHSTREMGVRLALGAERGAVSRLIVGRALRMAGLGAVVGLAAAAFLSRYLQSLLYNTPHLDPWIFGGLAALLLATSAAASWIPARRAARVDPAVTLREG